MRIIDSILSKELIDKHNREMLIHHFLANGDVASGTLQYLYAKQAAQSISDSTVNLLVKSSKSTNEIF